MILLTGLLTGCAFIAAGLAIWSAVQCARWSEHATERVNELKEMRARLLAAEHATEELSDRVRQLRGRVNERVRKPRVDVDDDDDDDANGLDPELAAHLELQRASPKAPGS